MNRVGESSVQERYAFELENASGYGEVWEIVKDTVKSSLHQRRDRMMLFLDDLPLQLGAYHQVGTNHIVLNRTLVQMVEASRSKGVVNALIYNLLLHEYLHALGNLSEHEVRHLVYKVAKECFGENHVVALVARESPWSLLKGLPLNVGGASNHTMEIVKDFEKIDQKYIV
jgi:hypothetical protein